MKRLFLLVFLLGITLVPKNSLSQLGIYGSVDTALDSARVNFVVQDTLGKSLVAVDSMRIRRYYNGNIIDSLTADSSQVTTPQTGYYEIAYEAATAYDSVGTYTIFVSVWVDGWNGGLALSYQVAKGGLKSLWDLTSYLGACDGCIRVLYPIGGMPKDSGWVIDTSKTPDDTLIYIRFNHSIENRVMDTLGTDLR